MPKRNILQIDQEKCDGCGQCILSCAEGAIQIVGGKARLVADVYCDGLGACVGHCPQGAITVIQREAAAFDEEQVRRRQVCPGTQPPGERPAAKSLQLPLVGPAGDVPPDRSGVSTASASALANWPIQLHLVPPNAPFLREADLLLSANCAPFAVADFHEQILRGRKVAIACPKLDDSRAYVEKLAAILRTASLRSLTVVRMEVPCCGGLLRIVEAAMRKSGVSLPVRELVVSRRGEMTHFGG